MHILLDKKINTKISPHFESREFICGCGKSSCTVSFISEELLFLLEEIRLYFNEPISVSSGYRCISHNLAVGGSNNSYHKRGEAADITVRDVMPQQVQEFIEKRYPNEYGLGKYKTFTHIDVRKNKARW